MQNGLDISPHLMKNNTWVKNDSLENYSKALMDDKYPCRKSKDLYENLLYANSR